LSRGNIENWNNWSGKPENGSGKPRPLPKTGGPQQIVIGSKQTQIQALLYRHGYNMRCLNGIEPVSKKRKLYDKLLTGSKNIGFSDLVTLLLAFGLTLD